MHRPPRGHTDVEQHASTTVPTQRGVGEQPLRRGELGGHDHRRCGELVNPRAGLDDHPQLAGAGGQAGDHRGPATDDIAHRRRTRSGHPQRGLGPSAAVGHQHHLRSQQLEQRLHVPAGAGSEELLGDTSTRHAVGVEPGTVAGHMLTRSRRQLPHRGFAPADDLRYVGVREREHLPQHERRPFQR